MLTGFLIGIVLVAMMATGLLAPAWTFNLLVPKDSGTAAIIRGAVYGPLPRHRLDVYAPTTAAEGPRPILVYLHGGSWATGSRTTYDFVGRAFAARGFTVIIPDYRLYPAVRYPAFLEDGAAAIAWARAHAAEIGGDPGRIVLVGHSAGGYNAAMLALDERWLAAAGVPREAIRAWAGLAGPYDFLPLEITAAINTFGEAPDLPATQPVNHVAAGNPPAFLAAGDADRTVAPRHTTILAAMLDAAGVPVDSRVYPGIGHLGIAVALAKPFRSWAPVLDETIAFLLRHIGPAPQP